MIKKSQSRFLLVCAMLLLGVGNINAQETTHSLSLKEAIDHAVQNNIKVVNSTLDAESAKARVGEIRAIGLPQINASIGIQDNLIVPKAFLPAQILNPQAEPGTFIPVAFQPQYQGNAAVTVNQLLFDGSYFIGLKAASTYKELAQKNLTRSKTEVAEAVSKAYYSVLVNQERLTIFNENIARLDSTLRETRAMFENGFVESIDVDRIEVSLNNLKVEKQKAERGVELTRALLKYQMGISVHDQIVLTDELKEMKVEAVSKPEKGSFNYSNRIDYSVLQTQQELAHLDIRNNRMGYYPRLVASGSYGYNAGSNEFDLYRVFGPKSVWLENAAIGVSLNIPIFDGLSKHYKIQQAKIAYKQTEQSLKAIANGIDLEIEQASVNLNNSLDALAVQERNLKLAQEVVRVAKIKYQQGVGSNIEVVNAESELRTSQTNYYGALYDVLISKVDFEKAQGILYQEK